MKSYDPRINRLKLPENEEKKETLEGHEHWETYEVFHQKKRGEQHVHVGIVHAPSPEAAIRNPRVWAPPCRTRPAKIGMRTA